MAAVKMLAFLFLGIGAFLVYGARFVAARLDKGNVDSETDDNESGSPEKHEAALEISETQAEDEEKIMQKIPSQSILKVKMAGMVLILAGGILVLVAFK
jgi:hypothetical protein